MNILAFILVGLIAGYLAGRVVEGHGFGLLGNVAIGIGGAFIGGFLFSQYAAPTFSDSITGATLVATMGSIVLLILVHALSTLTGAHPKT